MKLHINQLKLIRHLCRFNLLDYPSCLSLLDTAGIGDAVALSYAFRPLTKNGYISKHDDGTVAILKKGRSLFPEIKPLISVGGKATVERVIQVSRMALLMEENGIPCVGEIPKEKGIYFIPSACWRKIAQGIISTTRFTGMLLMGNERYAVYEIGDGKMEWQIRAEGSLFYMKYGTIETSATGMILICNDNARTDIAKNIIRQTMWSRRQLFIGGNTERTKPVRWSRSPIKLKPQFRHAYLMTPISFREDLEYLKREKHQIEVQSKTGDSLNDPIQGDYEIWPRIYFANPATDLLKYVYFFSAVKAGYLQYSIFYRKKDKDIVHMYPDVNTAEGVKFYEYTPMENNKAN